MIKITNLELFKGFSTIPRTQRNDPETFSSKEHADIYINTWLNFNSYITLAKQYGEQMGNAEIYGHLEIFGDEDRYSRKYLRSKIFADNLYIKQLTLKNLGYIKLPENFVSGSISCQKTFLVDMPNNLYNASRVHYSGTPEEEDAFLKYYEGNLKKLENKFNVKKDLRLFPTIDITNKFL